MTKYWPNRQSIHLNLSVANLFVQTYQRFSDKLSNKTRINLPIDILNIYIKKQLFIDILIELEILVIDLIELNLDIDNIKNLNNKILHDIVTKTMKNFINKLQHKKDAHLIYFYSSYNQLFFAEHKILIQDLLIYLVFGSNAIDAITFPFYKLKTPFNHVRILLENAIIQISNLIIFNLLENFPSIQATSQFLIRNNLCSDHNTSIRSISKFRNNLISYNWANQYIYYPQQIYCSKYKIWLLSSKGIFYKYIYINRSSEYLKLSKIQLSLILYLELQDFIIPKINSLIIILGKFIVYISIKIIGKGFQLCFRSIIQRIPQN
uniref:hypothetical protein n=1 Tax=Lithothamnion corallioides TaxID=1277934 RepID=UPI0023F32E5E|nr:hypothetical protein P6G75_pgp105 [Lithothamnion corallioides]WEA77132.1 hypothetical protein [Lithothamnion corallioides]